MQESLNRSVQSAKNDTATATATTVNTTTTNINENSNASQNINECDSVNPAAVPTPPSADNNDKIDDDCRNSLWQTMLGHTYDKLELDDSDKALEYYAQGSFADAKVVMNLVAKKFLSVYPTLNLKDWKSTKSSVPLLSRAGIVFDRQDLIFLSSHNILDTFLFGSAPDSMSNGSFVDSDAVDRLSLTSNSSMFSPINEKVSTNHSSNNQNSIISEEAGQTTTQQRPTLDILVFLKWAFSLGELVGLQAYRLVTELVHHFLCQELATLLEVDIMCLQELDPSFHLGLHKTVSAFVNSASLARLEAAGGNSYTNSNGNNGNSLNSSMRMNSYNSSTRQSTGGGVHSSPHTNGSQKQFATIDGVLNDRIVYSEAVGSSTPCELSVTLMVRVRELLRSSFIKTDQQNKVCVGESQFTSLNVTTDLFSTLLQSSAFSEFELETCKLQAVDLRGLSINALTMFFCNIYNTLIAHGTIVYSIRGAPGSTLYERNNFLKCFKYNIGGHLYSALDVSIMMIHEIVLVLVLVLILLVLFIYYKLTNIRCI